MSWTDEEARARYFAVETHGADISEVFGHLVLTLEAERDALIGQRDGWATIAKAAEARVRELERFHTEDAIAKDELTQERDAALRERDALRDRLAEAVRARDAAWSALYPLVVGCFEADAREDAPEFVNGEAERGRDALPQCGPCGGIGATDGREYVDEPIPEALRCTVCGGWGFLASVDAKP